MKDVKETLTACPDCVDDGRRDFLKKCGCAAAVITFSSLFSRPLLANLIRQDKPAKSTSASNDILVKLYKSLSDSQKKKIAFPWNHKRQRYVGNLVKVVDPTISDILNKDQRAMVRDILKGMTSEDGYKKFSKVMADDYNGFENFHCALFGEPETDKFQFMFTGHHLVLRRDGNSKDSIGFGGPIFYGHSRGDSVKNMPGNVWYYQTKEANKIFEALDKDQRKKALKTNAPQEGNKTIDVKSYKTNKIGITGQDMTKEQKGLLENLVKQILLPFRGTDSDEVQEIIKSGGGYDPVSIMFFKDSDIGSDKVWDRWLLTGPTIALYFRGSPHVHTWVNIAKTE